MALTSGVYAEKVGRDVPFVAPTESAAISTHLPAGKRNIQVDGFAAKIDEVGVSATGISVEMSNCIIDIKEVYIEKASPQKQLPIKK